MFPCRALPVRSLAWQCCRVLSLPRSYFNCGSAVFAGVKVAKEVATAIRGELPVPSPAKRVKASLATHTCLCPLFALGSACMQLGTARLGHGKTAAMPLLMCICVSFLQVLSSWPSSAWCLCGAATGEPCGLLQPGSWHWCLQRVSALLSRSTVCNCSAHAVTFSPTCRPA